MEIHNYIIVKNIVPNIIILKSAWCLQAHFFKCMYDLKYYTRKSLPVYLPAPSGSFMDLGSIFNASQGNNCRKQLVYKNPFTLNSLKASLTIYNCHMVSSRQHNV